MNTTMKTIYTSIVITLILTLSSINVQAQGIIVYQKDGTAVKYPYDKLDRIETYITDEAEPTVDYSVAVDLGLPSGTLWASYNIGATQPEEYGGFYAWGETIEKEEYNWDNYDWQNLTEDIIGTSHDVATTKWGGRWHMPSYDQAHELLEYCTWGIETINDVTCASLTGPNGNVVYFPITGYKYTKWWDDEGTVGCYWTGTVQSNNSSGVLAWDYGFENDYGDPWFGMPYFVAGNYGKPVRAVLDSSSEE